MRLCREVLSALLPPGTLWVPQDDEGLDLLLDGIADNAEALRSFLEGLSHLRDPMLTTILADLETEFGIVPDDAQTEPVRRARLLAAKTARSSDGSLDFMQEKLQAAGFPVTVYANNPAADPALFTGVAPSSIFGNEDALFGKTGALFGGLRGYLLVNGPTYYNQAKVQYAAPADATYWPLVFFVGGEVTRDGAGVITEIATVELPGSRKTEFNRLIVKYKPMHSWAGVVVNFV